MTLGAVSSAAVRGLGASSFHGGSAPPPHSGNSGGGLHAVECEAWCLRGDCKLPAYAQAL